MLPHQARNQWYDVLRAEYPDNGSVAQAYSHYEIWSQVCLYGIPLPHTAWSHRETSASFQRVALRYQSWCTQHQRLDAFQIPHLLIQHNNPSDVLGTLQLEGWLIQSPFLGSLLQSLEDRGWFHYAFKTPTSPHASAPPLAGTHDLPFIAQEACEWAKQHPEQSLGLVSEHWDAWTEHLPLWQRTVQQNGIHTQPRPRSRSLFQEPGFPIHFHLLALLQEPVSLSTLHACLRHASVIPEAEQTAAFQALNRLYAVGHSQWTAALLNDFLADCPIFYKRYHEARLYYQQHPPLASFSEWISCFIAVSHFFQREDLNDHNATTWFQTLKRWGDIPVSTHRLTAAEALNTLKEYAQAESHAQPASGAGFYFLAPHEIERHHLHDYWELCDPNAPPSTPQKLHRVIPPSLQHALCVREGSKNPTRLYHVTEYSSPHPSLNSVRVSNVSTPPHTHTPVTANEVLRGGTALLKHQAQCGFMAFAKHRLHTHPVEIPHLGITPAERGQWIHEALAHFWNTHSHSDNLHQLSDEALEKALLIARQKGLHTLEKRRGIRFLEPFRTLEIQRISQILQAWMAFEKTRPPFSVVAIEERKAIVVGPLSLNLVIDRIDRLEDGSYIALDYKTGAVSLLDWLGDPPLDPQIPLYCIASLPPIQAAAFAKVGLEHNDLTGAGLPHITLNGIQHTEPFDWNTLMAHWAQILPRLAEAFASGTAEVKPKTAQICQRCDLTALCRIHELSQTITSNG